MRSGQPWKWLLYLSVLAAVAVLLVSATRDMFARNPAREATTQLDPYGSVTVRFEVSPFPALPTGPLTLSFMPMNTRGVTVALDGIQIEYGRDGSDVAIGVLDTQPNADGTGVFVARAQFPTVGRWWIRAQLYKGSSQGAVRFALDVRPAQ